MSGAGLVEGSHSAEIAVRSTDGQTVPVAFTAEVLPARFTLTGGSPTFTAINGAPIAARTMSLAIDNGQAAPWTLTNPSTWLLATPDSGTAPATLTLQPEPSRGPLASGLHQTKLVLSSPGVTDQELVTQLTLTRATLATSPTAITLGGAKGRDLGAAQTTPLTLNTGTNTWPFTLSGLPAWLSTTTPSGRVGASGTSLSFMPRPGYETAGSVSASVTATATVNGDTLTVPVMVNLNVDQRRLVVSQPGAAFTSVPGAALLTRTLVVRDNFGASAPWTASSDAAWLSVTASGTAPGNVVLTANPATLPDATLSLATVTVTTTASAQPAVIRVGLWKSASGLASITRLPLPYAHLVADKIRPYIYANNGGTSIDVFNAYTATKIGTIASVGNALGEMSVSPDGSRLYAVDTAARTLVPVDLDTRTTLATWPLDRAANHATTVLAIRPNGADVVLVGDGSAYMDGRSLGASGIIGKLAATRDGRTVVTDGQRFSVDHSAMSGGVFFATSLGYVSGSSGGNLQDTAVSQDGSRIYQASGGGVAGGGYKCAAIDGATGTFIGAMSGGEAYPNNVEVLADGRAICAISGLYSTHDIFVHAAGGALLQSHKVSGYAKAILADRLVSTPDGFVVVALTNDPTIAFVPVQP
jgi:hypothetical protein